MEVALIETFNKIVRLMEEMESWSWHFRDGVDKKLIPPFLMRNVCDCTLLSGLLSHNWSRRRSVEKRIRNCTPLYLIYCFVSGLDGWLEGDCRKESKTTFTSYSTFIDRNAANYIRYTFYLTITYKTIIVNVLLTNVLFLLLSIDVASQPLHPVPTSYDQLIDQQ